MTRLTYEILLALADRERHGYGIIKELEARFGTAPSTAALYLALRRMEQNGLIAETQSAEPAADVRRRYYRLTSAGRAAAVAESVRLAALLKTARAKHLYPGSVDA